MVRSLKVIGLLLVSLMVGSVSAFTAKLPSSSRVAARWNTRDTVVVRAGVTIEKETVKTLGSPAVLDRSPSTDKKQAGSESWEVRIYNDSSNTREHVARSLVQVTGMSEMNAYHTMMQAHQNGIAVVGRWIYEIAEMYFEQLQKNGIVCDIVPVDEEC